MCTMINNDPKLVSDGDSSTREALAHGATVIRVTLDKVPRSSGLCKKEKSLKKCSNGAQMERM